MKTKYKFLIYFICIVVNNSYANDLKKNELLLLEVELNYKKINEVILAFIDEQSNVYVAKKDLQNFYISLPQHQPYFLNKKAYYQLNWLPQLKYSLDKSNLKLEIHSPLNQATITIFKKNKKELKKLRPEKPGLYLNYDVSAQHYDKVHINAINSILELNYFNKYGVGTSNFLLEKSNQQNQAIRLETRWVLDQPEKIKTFQWGDSVTRGSLWTHGIVRFAGFQYGTNFSTQPGFVTFPLPAFKGNNVIPSTINFLVNEQLQRKEQLTDGPFLIEDLSAMSGAGQLVVQTKDLLGRESNIILPYYTTPVLLNPNLKDFSYQIGFIREDFGLDSNHYGDLIGVGTYKKGISKKWTAEIHTELQKKQQTFGILNYYLFFDYAVISLASAISHTIQTQGALGLLGFQRQTSNYNYGIQTTLATKNFKDVGILQNNLAEKLNIQTYGSYTYPSLGSLSFNYTYFKGRTEPDIKLLNLSYSKTILKDIFFTSNYSHNFQQGLSDSFFISLVWSPGDNYTSSTTFNHQLGINEGIVQLNKNIPLEKDYVYQLFASKGDHAHVRANAMAQNDHGIYMGQWDNFDKVNFYQLNATGSIVYFGDHYFWTRPVDNAFALVQTGISKDIGIYANQQFIGKTNQYGQLFIPNLRPYEENNLEINPEDLPLTALFDLENHSLYPYYKSGVFAYFPMDFSQSYIMHIIDENGEYLPVGSTLALEQDKEIYTVGFEGQIYFKQLAPFKINQKLNGIVSFEHKNCKIQFSFPKTKNAVFDLGKIICKK